MTKIWNFTAVTLLFVLLLSFAVIAQDYLQPVFPPTLASGPFPFGTEEVRGDAPVDDTDPDEVVHEYTAYKGTVVVDGDLSDAAWAAIPWTLFEFNYDIPSGTEGSVWNEDFVPENWDGFADLSAWFKLIHDDENIYLALCRIDDDYSVVEGTDVDDGNIWQNDAYQMIIDTRYPFTWDEEMPGAEVGISIVYDLPVYHFWSTEHQNPATELLLADGNCTSGLTSTDGKAIMTSMVDGDEYYTQYVEAAFIKYPEMEDDMVGMLSICALDRDWDIHETVMQWAQGIYAKNKEEYGSVLWSAASVPTAVENAIAPNSFVLNQNYPNPFNPTTTISYTLAKQENISLKVYDTTGRLVASLASNELQAAGEHQVTFDAAKLSSGVYVYELQTPLQSLTRKMTILK